MDTYWQRNHPGHDFALGRVLKEGGSDSLRGPSAQYRASESGQGAEAGCHRKRNRGPGGDLSGSKVGAQISTTPSLRVVAAGFDTNADVCWWRWNSRGAGFGGVVRAHRRMTPLQTKRGQGVRLSCTRRSSQSGDRASDIKPENVFLAIRTGLMPPFK